ncbi:MAG: hypothetical protein CL489_00030 [Acidobacteria bacterium]|nr:hypothetical protein [Acidobacteriota bacterium]
MSIKKIRPSGQWSNRTSTTPPHFEQEPLVPQQDSSIHFRAQAPDLTYYDLSGEATIGVASEAEAAETYVHTSLTTQDESILLYLFPFISLAITVNHIDLDMSAFATTYIGVASAAEWELDYWVTERFYVSEPGSSTGNYPYTINTLVNGVTSTITPNPNLTSFNNNYDIDTLLGAPYILNLDYEYLSGEQSVNVSSTDLIDGYDPVGVQHTYANTLAAIVESDTEITQGQPYITYTAADPTDLSNDRTYILNDTSQNNVADGVEFTFDTSYDELTVQSSLILNDTSIEDLVHGVEVSLSSLATVTVGTWDQTYIINDTSISLLVIEHEEILVHEHDYHNEMEGLGQPGFIPNPNQLADNIPFDIKGLEENELTIVRFIEHMLLDSQEGSLSGDTGSTWNNSDVLVTLTAQVNFDLNSDDLDQGYDVFTIAHAGVLNALDPVSGNETDIEVDDTSVTFNVTGEALFNIFQSYDINSEDLDEGYDVSTVENIHGEIASVTYDVNDTSIGNVTHGVGNETIPTDDLNILTAQTSFAANHSGILDNQIQHATNVGPNVPYTIDGQLASNDLIVYGHTPLNTVEITINVDSDPQPPYIFQGTTMITHNHSLTYNDYIDIPGYAYYYVVPIENLINLIDNVGMVINDNFFQIIYHQNEDYVYYSEYYNINTTSLSFVAYPRPTLDYYAEDSHNYADDSVSTSEGGNI